jgi:hypothetical protein
MLPHLADRAEVTLFGFPKEHPKSRTPRDAPITSQIPGWEKLNYLIINLAQQVKRKISFRPKEKMLYTDRAPSWSSGGGRF